MVIKKFLKCNSYCNFAHLSLSEDSIHKLIKIIMLYKRVHLIGVLPNKKAKCTLTSEKSTGNSVLLPNFLKLIIIFG